MPEDKSKPSLVAGTLASVTTILGAPFIYGLTEPWVTPLLQRNYGSNFSDLYQLVWGVATAALVFFPSYAFFKFALTVLASAVLYRLI